MIKDINNLYLKYFDLKEENEVQKLVKEFLTSGHVKDTSFFDRLSDLANMEIEANPELQDRIYHVDSKEKLKSMLFPENSLKVEDETIEKIREKRKIMMMEERSVINDPLKEILFTSNIMLTLPKKLSNLGKKYSEKLDMGEQQKFWYDHPIPLDINDESNEILYGLQHFDESVDAELKGNYKVKIVLSVSCTHECIKKIAKEYLQEKIDGISLKHLEIFLFTENECKRLLELVYADQKDNTDYAKLTETFGVDGKYGRHYSFLKAVSVIFQKFYDPNIKATFKIDLDQVFDQKKTKEYTGGFCFEKFRNTKWGAQGIDHLGNPVKIGMLAGYLINDKDISKSMYEPDVPVPNEELTKEQYVFNSSRPQYLSTVAEMLNKDDKEKTAFIRYHVTGGMNGILLEDLLKYHPFTPTFITRAEDQAYILSVINKKVDGAYLRCFHKSQLFMRHDKETFLEEDLKKFEVPKKVGDYERILIFSHYANDILGDIKGIKNELWPFTSSFISEYPCLLVLYRALFCAYELSETSVEDGKIFLNLIVQRISKVLDEIEDKFYVHKYLDEKQAWDFYYEELAHYKVEGTKVSEYINEIKYQK